MSMTKSRRNVYNRSWYKRECKINMRVRRKEYNRKIRHTKITEDSTANECKHLNKLEWNTMS